MRIFGLTVGPICRAGFTVCALRLWTGLGTDFARFVKSGGFVSNAAVLAAGLRKAWKAPAGLMNTTTDSLPGKTIRRRF